MTENVRHLLIERARIVKSARAKVAVATAVLDENYEDGQAWLVYCDNIRQVAAMRQACSARGLRTLEYHTQMEGDGEAALAEFAREGGILVAINCLDEGVDIPRISDALVLASSTTRMASSNDAAVFSASMTRSTAPSSMTCLSTRLASKNPGAVSFMRTELARALEFVGSAVDSLQRRFVSARLPQGLMST